MKENYKTSEDTGIDLLKFIAAILVAISHIGILVPINETFEKYFINISFRWCVPFFFVCAGYYLNSKLSKIIKYELRLIILYAVWTLFYIVVNNMDCSVASIINYIRLGVIPSFWYFPSLICGVLFVYLINKIFPQEVSFIIVLALYIIALFGDAYANVMLMGHGIKFHLVE